MVQGYCLKEKKKVDISSPVFELNKRGTPIVRGKCSSCGGKVYAILKSEDAPADLRAKAAAFKAKKGGSKAGSKAGAKRKSRKSVKSRKSKKSAKGSKRSKRSRKSKRSKSSKRSKRSRR